MEFQEEIEELCKRIKQYGESLKTEEATKNTLVMPFIKMLGYDPFNPTEVVPEFDAAVGVKKDSRVDYAIMVDGKPIMIFECKSLGTQLGYEQADQLHRYFNGCEARVAILTDGNHYLFYTDLEAPNKMDHKPYMEFRLDKLDQSLLPEIRKLTKAKFNVEDALDSAADLKYSREFRRIMKEQLENPSDEFLRFFVKQCYSKQITEKARERFHPLLKASLKLFIDDILNERFANFMNAKSDEQQTQTDAAAQNAAANQEGAPTESENEDGVVTTEDEWQAYYIIKSILMGQVDGERVILKDYKSLCKISLDRISNVLVKLYFNSTPYKISLNTTDAEGNKTEVMHQIDKLDDIYKHADEIKMIAKEFAPQ